MIPSYYEPANQSSGSQPAKLRTRPTRTKKRYHHTRTPRAVLNYGGPPDLSPSAAARFLFKVPTATHTSWLRRYPAYREAWQTLKAEGRVALRGDELWASKDWPAAVTAAREAGAMSMTDILLRAGIPFHLHARWYRAGKAGYREAWSGRGSWHTAADTFKAGGVTRQRIRARAALDRR